MVTLIIVHVAKRLARLWKDVSETWREAQRFAPKPQLKQSGANPASEAVHREREEEWR